MARIVKPQMLSGLLALAFVMALPSVWGPHVGPPGGAARAVAADQPTVQPAGGSGTPSTAATREHYIDVTTFDELQRAVQVDAKPGDVIRVHPGVYPLSGRFHQLALSRSGTRDKPITVRGIVRQGRLPVMEAAADLATNKAFFVLGEDAKYWVFENLEFRGLRGREAFSPFTAAIYIGTDNTTVRNCRIHDCDQGLQSSSHINDTLIEYCEIYDCGCDQNPGYSHLMYMYDNTLTVRGCYLHDAHGGMLFKSRCAHHVLEYNWLENDGSVSCTANVASGNEGNALWRGNVFIKRRTQGDQRRMLTVNDTTSKVVGTLTLINNTIISSRAEDIYIAHMPGSTCKVVLKNNLFAGPSSQLLDWQVSMTQLSGCNNAFTTALEPAPAALTNSMYTDALFVDLAGRDLRLLRTSPCVSGGDSCPTWLDGHDQWVNGTPTQEPGKSLQLLTRPRGAGLSVGAFQYAAVTATKQTVD